jgi:hypothetical protein
MSSDRGMAKAWPASNGFAIEPKVLSRSAAIVASTRPRAVLVRNQVGHLSIIDGDLYVGRLDLISGEVEFWEGIPWADHWEGGEHDTTTHHHVTKADWFPRDE